MMTKSAIDSLQRGYDSNQTVCLYSHTVADVPAENSSARVDVANHDCVLPTPCCAKKIRPSHLGRNM